MSKAVQEMFRGISSRYDITNDVISLGIHRSWKRLLRQKAALREGDLALDICTGTGEVALELNRKFPGRVIGVDFVKEMVTRAIRKSGEIKFFVGDAQQLPFNDSSVGLVTISFGIRNLDSPLMGLKEMLRVLKPNSKVLILEFGEANRSWFNLIYKPYSRYVIPFLGGLLTGDKAAYEYLPETSARFPARENFIKLMEQAGFKNCNYKSLSFGVAYIYEGVKA